MEKELTDVIIIGAGLSGIGAACHLKRKNPEKSFRILEARTEIGGTWSLFQYPGIRSDSDMYTFGYSFKPWHDDRSFADGPAILQYVTEAAEEYQVEKHIIYQRKVVSYNYDSAQHRWNIKAIDPSTQAEYSYTARFIFNCSGYYNYAHGHTPTFAGLDNYQGIFIHPQQWDTNLDYQDKEVVVIGSGATAVTLVPKMAENARTATMLQRSPTYIGALPNRDKIAGFLRKILPAMIVHKLVRIKNILYGIFFFWACQTWPNTVRKILLRRIQKELGDFPIEPHFAPHYKPWDQRFCLVPDGDLFQTIKQGKAKVVTDTIDSFVEKGILLTSGKVLEADIVVSATGLQLLPLGGAEVAIDHEVFDFTKSFTYKGLMLSGIPNFFIFTGYTNASWTLKSDLTSEYVARLLRYLDKHQYQMVTAKVIEDDLKAIPLLNLDSGYINRANDILPKQGDRFPWRLYQNYLFDFFVLRLARIEDPRLTFSK